MCKMLMRFMKNVEKYEKKWENVVTGGGGEIEWGGVP